jgi:S1-C subfamily serine protease
MTESHNSTGRALFAAVVGSLSLAASAGAQRSSSPTGWVGLSVIQSGHGESGTGVTIGYPVVASVEPGSPAQSAGLVAGDTILAYNDADAQRDPTAVKRYLKAGSQLRIKIRRNGVRSLTLTVARRSAQNVYREGVTINSEDTDALPLITPVGGAPIAFAASVASGRSAPFAGSYFARVNAGLAGALRVKPEGVLVVDVGAGSAAMRSGLQSGDVITRADSIAVSSPLAIAAAMRLAAGRSIKLDVVRHGQPQKITVSW